MGTYGTNTGERFTTSQIDVKVRKAKMQKINNMLDDIGYVVCEDCKRNDCVPVDCSHDISVKEAKESGESQLAWDVDNITMRGRSCHRKHDCTY